MPTVILVRHGRTTANATGLLAGRTPGVQLDETGQEQVRRTGERLAVVDLAAVVTSPLERCRQTAQAVWDEQTGPVPLLVEDDLTECDYGEWQNQKLADLAKEDLWRVVQSAPSAVTFPGGESMAWMQHRAVAAIRRHDARIAEEHGARAVWVAVSHGDIIKSILADALGMHLDAFQRLSVSPASASIVRYGSGRPDVVSVNTEAGDLSWLRPPADAGDDASTGDPAAGSGTLGGGDSPGAPRPPRS